MQCPLAATRGHQAHGRLEGGRRWLGAECGAGAEAGRGRQPAATGMQVLVGVLEVNSAQAS